MAKLTITVPDSIVGDMLDALSLHAGPDAADLTKTEMAREVVRHWLRGIYCDYKGRQAVEVAAEQAVAAATAASQGLDVT